MLSELPVDVLELIADFVRDSHLSLTCSYLWHCLRLRFVRVGKFRVNPPQDVLDQFAECATLQLENIQVHNHTALQSVCNANRLHTLSMELFYISDDNVADLVHIFNNKRLQHLGLCFHAPSVGTLSSKTLTYMQEVLHLPQLQSLSFSMNFVEIGDQLGMFGSMMRQWTSLETINLSFSWAAIANPGAIGLAEGLKELHTLKHVSLDFVGNEIQTDGVGSLANAIAGLPRLSTLNCNLRLNPLRQGTSCLGALGEVKTLETATLGLQRTQSNDRWVLNLAHIGAAKQLRSLTMDFRGNAITDAAVVRLRKNLKAVETLSIVHEW
eukprot:TRINITY_DN67960_c7_g1_i6.p1 TRINITY_DN67960_c7_g1~~TRINITY_DN67960_c7_g1_i6.p1  ORF type:complete len:325 (+),score=10.78 TRINITY_DN67960_c7_g1_i6:44-1018(+)